MYNEKVLERFNNLKNAGIIRGADGIGIAENSEYGEIVKIYIKVEDNKISDARFKTFGSVAAIVASSVVAEIIIGKALSEVAIIKEDDILKVTEAFPKDKEYSLSLVKEAVHLAVEDYGSRLEKQTKKSKKK